MRLFLTVGIALCFAIVAGCSAETVSVDERAPAAQASPPAVDVKQADTKQAAAEAAQAVDQEVRRPATAAEAAQAIDLSTFPLLPSVLEIRARSVARLDYIASLETFDVKSEYEFQRRGLLERQWKELTDSQISSGYAEGQFSRSGFHLYVTVQFHDEPGKVLVRLQNNSNVHVSKLPVPPGATFLGVSHNIASFETTTGVKETREAVRKLLLEQGWQPYGSGGNRLILKQNAVELTAVVEAQSAQPGKTRIAYWTVQMSADLPAPPDAESILYDDKIKRLDLIASGSPDEVGAYYQTALAPAQWKAATEKPVKQGVESIMIFRNPAQDLLHLQMRDLRDRQKTRVSLKHQSAAEVEESDRQGVERNKLQGKQN
jgi:hypothetical protein